MTSVDFERFVGIDWSGAKECSNRGIQVAEFFRGTSHPKLVAPIANSYWTRSAVLKYIRSLDDRPTLIGLDFAFSVPWPEEAGPLRVPDQKLRNVHDLWERVERICEGESNDLFAGPVWLSHHSPFRPFIYHYHSKHKGDLYCRERLRITEKMAPRRPISIYHMAGAQVGQGSFAGMRLLHALCEGDVDVAVWPFHRVDDARVTIVEVYPSLFYSQARQRRPRKKDKDEVFFESVRKTLMHFDIRDGHQECSHSVDKADAIVTAAALSSIVSHPNAFMVPDGLMNEAMREGWIFGVPFGSNP